MIIRRQPWLFVPVTVQVALPRGRSSGEVRDDDGSPTSGEAAI